MSHLSSTVSSRDGQRAVRQALLNADRSCLGKIFAKEDKNMPTAIFLLPVLPEFALVTSSVFIHKRLNVHVCVLSPLFLLYIQRRIKRFFVGNFSHVHTRAYLLSSEFTLQKHYTVFAKHKVSSAF